MLTVLNYVRCGLTTNTTVMINEEKIDYISFANNPPATITFDSGSNLPLQFCNFSQAYTWIVDNLNTTVSLGAVAEMEWE